jgi:zinc/manganese transport system substrate-binding protein
VRMSISPLTSVGHGALLLIGILIWAVAGTANCAADDSHPLRVVCANTILADIARQVGGDRIVAISLLKPGVDVHAWEPTPDDIALIGSAGLVVVNGLGLEGWLDRAINSSGVTAPVVRASAGIEPLPIITQGDGAQPHAGQQGVDPHAWQDVSNGMRYARTIRDALITVDPHGAADYTAWAQAYDAQLRVVDAWVKQQIASLPASQRVLVTSHDALGYFGKAYGMEIQPVEGIAPGQEPDAARIAALITVIRTRHVHAIFIEDMSSSKVIEQIGAEGGARLGGQLYSDSLAEPHHLASTYLGMFLANARTIVAALQ